MLTRSLAQDRLGIYITEFGCLLFPASSLLCHFRRKQVIYTTTLINTSLTDNNNIVFVLFCDKSLVGEQSGMVFYFNLVYAPWRRSG